MKYLYTFYIHIFTLYTHVIHSVLQATGAYACMYMGLGQAGRAEGYMAAADAAPRLDRVRLYIHPYHASC